MIFISGKIFLIYIKNKIDETDDSYEIPILISIFFYLLSSNASCKCLLFIKHSIQLHNDLGRPLREISLLKCLCITLAIIIYKFGNNRDLYCCLYIERKRKKKEEEELILKLIIFFHKYIKK